MFEIHTGNQWQSLILPVLAKALGRDEKTIVLRTYLLGGGFGRRLNGDYAVPVALAAKAVGRSVKMVCLRPDDMRFDSPRSPSVQVVRMAFGDDGKVTAMQHHAAAGWPTEVIAPPFMPRDANGVPYDPFSINGADHWYTVGAQRVRAISNDLANRTFRPGWLRSVGPGWTNWAVESFMDEAAHTAGVDPVTFRLQLLDGAGRNAGSAPYAVGGARRQAAVLARAAQKAGWGEALPNDTGLGVATSFGQERDMPTWVACVARVARRSAPAALLKSRNSPGGRRRHHRPSRQRQAQVEGASLWGLSMALHEGSALVNGQAKDTNLDTYTPLRMGDVAGASRSNSSTARRCPPASASRPPRWSVLRSPTRSSLACGARLRHLPIRPEAVLQALNPRA